MKSVLTSVITATSVIVFATGCPMFCFVAGTRVLTRNGPKAIEVLRVGEKVWSFDTASGERVLRPVSKLVRGESYQTHRVVAGEQVIEGVTDEHPFWCPLRNEWVKAKDLITGDTVLCWHGAHEAKVLPITSLETTVHEQPVQVFTLTVEGPEHNYFAEGLLVHNKSILLPHEPQDLGPCVEASNLEFESSYDFGDVIEGETASHTITFSLVEDLECNLPDDGEEIEITLDDPDGAFQLGNSWEGITFSALRDSENTPLEITFEPPTSGDFEAQIQIGFPSTTDDEFRSDIRIQIFGSGVSVQEE